MNRLTKVALLLMALIAASLSCGAETRDVILATTTSTYDTGLLDVLIPRFQEEMGYVVKPIAVGTGKALAMGERGEADVLLVHAPDSERALLQEGAVVNRRLVMHNYFAIVGPLEDPAAVAGGTKASTALGKVAEAQALFMSRGDDSGTHKMERSLWEEVGLTPSGRWYQETGQGMGATLRIASEKQAYTLTDSGTFLALRHTLDLEVMAQGDPSLLNLYSVMQVNPDRFPKVNARGAEAFVTFLLSQPTQSTIEEFGMERFEEALFIPSARKTEGELR